MNESDIKKIQQEKLDFSKLGKPFQKSLVKIILNDRPFSDRIGEVLEYHFFELKFLRLILKELYAYKEKYKMHPSPETIRILGNTKYESENEAIQLQIKTFLEDALDFENRVHDKEYIMEKAIDFCRTQKMKEAIMRSIETLANEPSSSFDIISSTINEALKLGSDNDIGYDYDADFEKRFLPEQRNPISTGLPRFDEKVSGGLGKAELAVLLAPTNSGKTTSMCFVGSQALLQGKTVVHYTLEEKETKIGNKYDAGIAGISLNDLLQNKFVIRNAINRKINSIGGRLIIKEYPTKSASVKTISRHIERLHQRDVFPDLIIVDYADLLKPSYNGENNRSNLQGIYEDLRALAMRLDVAILTASQTNRTGQGVRVVTMDMISEAYAKCFVADLIFTLSRTDDDKECNGGRFYIAKNRNGTTGDILELEMDPEFVQFQVVDQPMGGSGDSEPDMTTRMVNLYDQFRERNS